MRIALLNWPVAAVKGDLYGGLETSLVDLKRGLARCGHAVSLYGRVDGDSAEFQSTPFCTIPYLGADRYYRFFLRQSSGADILHFHNCPQGALYRPERSVAVFQNELHIDYHRVFPGRYNRSCFVFVSEYLKHAVLSRHPGLHPRRCTVVHNAVDTDLFRPADGPATGPLPVVTYAGQWNARKGFDVLLAAKRLLQQRGVKFVLRLAGGGDLWPGPSGFSQEETSSLLNGLDDVERLGKLSQHELSAALARSTIAVVPSVWAEPFGKAAIEAMACGLPVIASRAGGLLEIVRHGETGLLVEPGDAVALADAMQQLIEDRDRTRVMGREARSEAVRRFSLDQWIQRFEDLHAEILADG
ncbi:MAG: glycosyltransferase family 4 protein [Candidatus Edwardsbacteria bacterium]|nr:glycosyltransferase family 4 protein [Candidatus Edwardsbacteria bacterium]